MIHDYRTKLSKSERKNLEMLLNYDHYSFVIQIQSRYDETTHFSSEMQKVLQKFLQATLWRDNTSLQNIYNV